MFNLLKIYEKVQIQAYKHDGSFHRSWTSSTVLDRNKDFVVVGSNKCLVLEQGNKKWVTKEPSISFYYHEKWFNIIAMIRGNGIHYYCNIASPSIYDYEAIKNIDYDLDLKVYPNYEYKILDKTEYFNHIKKYGYPEVIQNKIMKAMEELTNMVNERKDPFNIKCINKYLQIYCRTENK